MLVSISDVILTSQFRVCVIYKETRRWSSEAQSNPTSQTHKVSLVPPQYLALSWALQDSKEEDKRQFTPPWGRKWGQSIE